MDRRIKSGQVYLSIKSMYVIDIINISEIASKVPFSKVEKKRFKLLHSCTFLSSARSSESWMCTELHFWSERCHTRIDSRHVKNLAKLPVLAHL